jgi:hypothetical protein
MDVVQCRIQGPRRALTQHCDSHAVSPVGESCPLNPTLNHRAPRAATEAASQTVVTTDEHR